MRVLGTAGHVDHGKSTLVECLTGINPDRLKEEQMRQMTIDLGFAWMDLPGGETVGIIDVPGHRDFIENMLAGVGGIDAALMVIAADEGIMPQTREHLAILDLLEVNDCVVALTKSDLVDDPAWMDLVREETAGLLSTTRFANAKIVPVSAKTREGIDELLDALEEVLGRPRQQGYSGKPRLPIDRAFTISGFGTVVTGTLIDGKLAEGQLVSILPGDRQGRIRGLQTHKEKVKEAIPGSRVAANLASIDAGSIDRGDVICLPGDYVETRVLDAKIRLLADSPSGLRHNQRVKIFIGAAQRMARIRLLGMDSMEVGRTGWIQLVLEEPVVAARGDRYIMRRPSPGATLGGGQIADAHPSRLYRRKNSKELERLDRLLHGGDEDVLVEILAKSGAMKRKELMEKSGLDDESALDAMSDLEKDGRIIVLEEAKADSSRDGWIIDGQGYAARLGEIHRALETYHDRYPLREGMPREELRSKLRFDAKVLALILEHAIRGKTLGEDGLRIRQMQHKPRPNDTEQAAIDRLMKRFESDGYSPPSVKEALEAVGEEVFAYLLASDQLVKLSADVVYERGTYGRMRDAIKRELEAKKTITVAEVRDLFGTSRKFALAIMEHLDEIGVTVREGDTRRLA